jgi:hypothetical protein
MVVKKTNQLRGEIRDDNEMGNFSITQDKASPVAKVTIKFTLKNG